MSKKKKTMLVAAIVLGIAVLGLAAGVYAKYIASFTADGDIADVAKWAFKDENDDGLLECKLDKNYNTDTLSEGRIAPGTSGTCTFSVTNENSEVGVNYTITLSSVTNQPTNVKFYKTKSDSGDNITYTDELTTTNGSVTGTINAGVATAQTKEIYWVWPYETGTVTDGVAQGDSDDTTDGENAATATKKMTATFAIKGVQVQPTEQ
ncbi:hypothetical protein IJV57_03040 [Candidatus Saccharibacteria bacterium]|nr:hypothetical protein [Candidatus Saccharibacteria bacterium]